MVISVPHSGTRSLLKYLGFTGINHRASNNATGTASLHFGHDDERIFAYTGPVEIPLRPLRDTVASFLARGKDPDFAFRAYSTMMEYVRTSKNPIKLYPVELLGDICVGSRPKDQKYVRKAEKLTKEWLTHASNLESQAILLADPRVQRIKSPS